MVYTKRNLCLYIFHRILHKMTLSIFNVLKNLKSSTYVIVLRSTLSLNLVIADRYAKSINQVTKMISQVQSTYEYKVRMAIHEQTQNLNNMIRTYEERLFQLISSILITC